jgi:hypoxanthine phosphoribosyltransferase
MSGSVKILLTENEIADANKRLAREIALDFAGREPLLIPLLRGSFVFAADLVRALSREQMRLKVDFMTLSSYGAATTSSGTVKITRDIEERVDGHDVVIVDDILESGRTLSFARDLMLERGAKSVKAAVLLHKTGKLVTDAKADYVGFAIPDKFVVGYGLDWASRYRELPFIGVVE